MFDHETITLHWAQRLSVLVRKALTERFAAAGLEVTTEEWAILLILWRDGPQSPGVIASRTFRDRTTVTRLVDGMVRKDLVTRAEDPADRRRSVLLLTDRGTAIRADLMPIAQTLIAEAQMGIPADDIATTLRTLRAMTRNLAPGEDRIDSRERGKP